MSARLTRLVLCAGLVAVHAEFADVKDVHVIEQQIVRQFAKLSALDAAARLSATVQCQLDELRRALEPLGLGVQLIHMRHTASIAVFFLLMALPDLHRFTDVYATGKLRSVLDRVFSCLFDNGLRLVINRLVCRDGGLSQQRKHFEILQGTAQNIYYMYNKLTKILKCCAKCAFN